MYNAMEIIATKEEIDETSKSNRTAVHGERNSFNQQGSMVEVEEWDRSRAKKSRKSKKMDPNREISMKANKVEAFSQVDVEVDSNLRSKEATVFHNKTSKQQEPDFFVKFCDRVFDDPKVVPNICNRPHVEISNKKHIAVSKKSLSFRKLGEIKVFSTFLDVRGEPHVRAMVLGPSGQSSGPSTYWCVFHDLDNTENVMGGDKGTHFGTGGNPGSRKEYLSGYKATNGDAANKMDPTLGSTVMAFYAASDGHGRVNRFFIASCPVPQRAFPLFSHADVRLRTIQMVVGSLETAFLGAVQDTTFVDVIINKHIKQESLPASSLTWQNLGKTILVDVRATESKNAARNNGDDDTKHHGFVEDHQKKALRVFELDDDDEDKEISREKKHISILHGGKVRSDGSILVQHPQTKEVGEIIASCVAPLHGRVSAIQVVEFIELSLLLGVQHIVFYVPSSQELTDAQTVIRMYETRGLVTRLPWDLPGAGQGNHSGPDDVWARGRDVALNDCLYRTIHGFDWALFLDLDEFFVPRVTPDLPSFLRYLAVQHRFNASRTTDLVFPSVFFPPPTRDHYKNLTTVPGFLRDINKFSTLKSVHRTLFDQKQALRMLRPETVARVGASERRKTAFTLSHRYAAVHHYSFCPRTETNAKVAAEKPQGGVSCNHLKVDWTMWRFKTLLVERAAAAMTVLTKG